MQIESNTLNVTVTAIARMKQNGRMPLGRDVFLQLRNRTARFSSMITLSLLSLEHYHVAEKCDKMVVIELSIHTRLLMQVELHSKFAIEGHNP